MAHLPPLPTPLHIPNYNPLAVDWLPMKSAWQTGKWMVFKLDGDSRQYFVQFGHRDEASSTGWTCMNNLTGEIAECSPLGWWPIPEYQRK